MRRPLTARIDQWNDRFFAACRARLQLDRLATPRLEWLLLEHFQFSQRNPKLLQHAAQAAATLPEVRAELLRNCAQETDHAALYAAGLAAVNIHVHRRRRFRATDEFLDWLHELIGVTASQTLGVMYATESAALFEHAVFREVGEAWAARQGLCATSAALRNFHDLHLQGVEQEHKDGLGVFINAAHRARARSGQLIIPLGVATGARRAITAMVAWWDAMLSHCCL